MTDKLTPPRLPGWALRDLADIIDAIPSGEYGAPHFREEAARREAEARPGLSTLNPELRAAMEREGPGSAAAHLKLRDIAPNETVRAVIDKMASEGAVLIPDKPAPAADDLVSWLRHEAFESSDKLTRIQLTEAADRIEQQAREIAQLREALEQVVRCVESGNPKTAAAHAIAANIRSLKVPDVAV